MCPEFDAAQAAYAEVSAKTTARPLQDPAYAPVAAAFEAIPAECGRYAVAMQIAADLRVGMHAGLEEAKAEAHRAGSAQRRLAAQKYLNLVNSGRQNGPEARTTYDSRGRRVEPSRVLNAPVAAPKGLQEEVEAIQRESVRALVKRQLDCKARADKALDECIKWCDPDGDMFADTACTRKCRAGDPSYRALSDECRKIN